MDDNALTRQQSEAVVALLPGRLPEGAVATAALAGHGYDGITVDFQAPQGFVSLYIDTTWGGDDEPGDGLRLYVTVGPDAVPHDSGWDLPPSPRPDAGAGACADWVVAVTAAVVGSCLDGTLATHAV
jgi:hypothetical protein